jgi:hypothetical protein
MFHSKEMILLEKTFGEWLVKPDQDSNWLWVELAPERKNGKFDVTVKTVAEYVVSNPTKGLLLDLETPKSS